MPLNDIYELSDEDYQGLIMVNNEMQDEQVSSSSGKPHTRRPTAKELKMLKNKG